MKFRSLFSLLFLASPALYGQAVPAGVATVSTGPNLPPMDGVLHYALSASETAQLGYYGAGETTASTVLSGDVSFASKSVSKPFSITFAGGVVFPNVGDQGGVSTFQNVSVSQGLVLKHWSFGISDTFNFLPQSPTTGISGIPGVGDIGVVPLPLPSEGYSGGLLTEAGDRYSNTLSGSVERFLGPLTSISGGASWSTLSFLGSEPDRGIGSTQTMGMVSVNRRLDARSSVSVGGSYSDFDYGGSETANEQPGIKSKAINVSYSRSLNRSLSISASVGPQWVSSSDNALVPSSLSVATSVGASYVKRHTTASLSYSRGINAGSGVLPGAETDSFSGSVGHPFGRQWLVSLMGAYQHSTGLAEVPVSPDVLLVAKETFNTVYGGVQVSRSFSQHYSGYASYTAANQSSNFVVPGQNAFSGISQTFGIGVSFSPRSTRLGQF